jgi:integrase
MPRAATRQNHGTHTFKRGSVFWVRLHSPPGTWSPDESKDTGRLQKSLGTTNPLEAKERAAPFIERHCRALRAARPRFETVWQHDFEPGEHVQPDGSRIIATTDRQMIRIGTDGVPRMEPNGCEMRREALSGVAINPVYASPTSPRAVVEAWGGERRKPAAANADDQLLENYLERGGKNGTGVAASKQSEAKAVWAKFKELTGNKPLKDCKVADAKLLVKHYQEAKNKSATVHKKLVWLSAMVNLAIFEGELDSDYRNPFLRAAPHLDDATDRSKGFRAAEIEAIKKGLDGIGPDGQKLARPLPADDVLLVRWLACTGARLSEISTVDREQVSDDGIRFMHIGKKPGGKKTDASVRDLPLPVWLPGFPDKIDGPYFRDPEGASKRLNKFLKDVGVWVKQEKVIHSFRHTATNRLRNEFGYTEDWTDALLGHASPLYGEYNLPKFQEMIGKIGL